MKKGHVFFIRPASPERKIYELTVGALAGLPITYVAEDMPGVQTSHDKSYGINGASSPAISSVI